MVAFFCDLNHTMAIPLGLTLYFDTQYRIISSSNKAKEALKMNLTFKKFHMNNAVKVKLNEIGHAEMERQHNELYASVGLSYRPFTRKHVDDDGYSTFQLHCLMNTFGHMMTCGGELPFDDLNILLADQLLEDA